MDLWSISIFPLQKENLVFWILKNKLGTFNLKGRIKCDLVESKGKICSEFAYFKVSFDLIDKT